MAPIIFSGISPRSNPRGCVSSSAIIFVCDDVVNTLAGVTTVAGGADGCCGTIDADDVDEVDDVGASTFFFFDDAPSASGLLRF